MTTVVLFGPHLPGRDVLEHALARALPVGTRLEVGDFLTARERRDRAAALATAGERAVFVAREPTPADARREIYHHYAAMPPRLADLRWQAFLDDNAQREPAQDESWPTIILHGDEPIEAAVSQIVRVVGPGEVPTPGGPRRILVVDDDPVQLELVAGALTTLGCDVTTAASAEEAMDRVREQAFDLVVSDECMPGARGTDLAAAMSTLQPGLRVAIVTGFPDAAAGKLGRGPNVDLVLAKPLGINDLVHMVEEMARHT